MENISHVLKASTKHSSYLQSNLIKTPSFSHIENCDWERVYEPAEDSFLLMDALEKDLHYILSKKPGVILEIGSGSGVLITALATTLKSSAYYLAIDIEEYACNITKSISGHNKTDVDVIQGDLTSCLKKSSVDMIIFNPPYVPTPNEEVYSKDSLTKSWAGGIDGTQIINRFLNNLVDVVSKNSFGYFVLIKENNPRKIMDALSAKHFNCEIILERKIRGEELSVLKFVRNQFRGM